MGQTQSVYPVEYRNKPRGGNQPAGPRQPVRPANDNPRPLRPAANDNYRSRPRVPRNAGRLGLIARRLPYIGVGLLLYDLYELYTDNWSGVHTASGLDNGPWYKTDTCGSLLPQTGPPYSMKGNHTLCLANQAIGNQVQWGQPRTYYNSNRNVSKMREHKTAPRYQVEEKWKRDTGGTITQSPEQVSEVTQPYAPPLPIIPLIPAQIPVQQPVEILPVPWAATPLRPTTDLGHGYESGYGTPEPVTVPIFHSPPPGPNTVERKVRSGNAATTFLLGAVNLVTESVDLLDALYYALPEDVRVPGASFTERAEILYDNYDQIDVAEAIENILINELQDRIIGTAAGSIDPSAFGNRPVGPLAGPAL